MFIHNWNHISLDIKSLTSYHSTLTFFSKFVFFIFLIFWDRAPKSQRQNASKTWLMIYQSRCT